MNLKREDDFMNQESPALRPGKGMFRSEELFQGKREVLIEHSGVFYRLKITKSGKLILNK